MSLMREIYFIFYIHLLGPEVFCKVFEFNQNCIAVAESNNFSPRTKNIAIKYQHFQYFVQNKIIRVFYTDAGEQTADLLTKTLNKA